VCMLHGCCIETSVVSCRWCGKYGLGQVVDMFGRSLNH